MFSAQACSGQLAGSLPLLPKVMVAVHGVVNTPLSSTVNWSWRCFPAEFAFLIPRADVMLLCIAFEPGFGGVGGEQLISFDDVQSLRVRRAAPGILSARQGGGKRRDDLSAMVAPPFPFPRPALSPGC